jgi:benzoylformate decarboxylase
VPAPPPGTPASRASSAGIPTLASHLAGHDVVVAFGAAIFRYHEFIDSDYLPEGTELWAVTADPDKATRPRFGHILIGDPVDAITRLADTTPSAGRPPLPARQPVPQADTTGPAFTWEAILDAVGRGQDPQHGHRARVDLGRRQVGPAGAHLPGEPVLLASGGLS